MSKLIEVLRRLLLASMYITVPILIGIMIRNGYDEWTEYLQTDDAANGERMLFFYGIAGGALITLPVGHKLINRILLKD